VPYLEEDIHGQFRTHVYGFTWEDPDVDVKTLRLTSADSMLVITSAGDNALHYAIASKPYRIHCVDMNPCQNNILELKLAAAQALPFDEYFALFGTGRVVDFRALLDTKLAPYLSSHAYQYWCLNETSFADNFHFRGYSGHALRLAQWAFWLAGVRKDALVSDPPPVDVPGLSFADGRGFVTPPQGHVHSEQQVGAGEGLEGAGQSDCSLNALLVQSLTYALPFAPQLRPVIMNPVLMAILGSPVFLWNALGVPLNQVRRQPDAPSSARMLISPPPPWPAPFQMRMFLQDGTTADFVAATLDPVAKLASLKHGAYHYLLCLSGRYTPESCPLYLTKAGYEELRKNGNQAVSTFRLHTATIMNVLRGLPDGTLTKAILMDSQVCRLRVETLRLTVTDVDLPPGLVYADRPGDTAPSARRRLVQGSRPDGGDARAGARRA
jgi:betaine lipid synthase